MKLCETCWWDEAIEESYFAKSSRECFWSNWSAIACVKRQRFALLSNKRFVGKQTTMAGNYMEIKVRVIIFIKNGLKHRQLHEEPLVAMNRCCYTCEEKDGRWVLVIGYLLRLNLIHVQATIAWRVIFGNGNVIPQELP